MNGKAWIILIIFLAWSLFCWNWVNSNKKVCCTANPSLIQKSVPVKTLNFPLYFTLNSPLAQVGSGFTNLKENQLAGMGPFDTLEIHAWSFNNESGGDTLARIRGENIKALFSEMDEKKIKISVEKRSGNMDPSSEGFEAASLNTIHKKGSLIQKLKNAVRIYFPLNSGEKVMEPEIENYLDSLASDMKSKLNLKVEIRGYTDSTGSIEQNIKLSQKRANFIKSHLIIKGVDSSRIKSLGLGPKNPIADNESPEGKSKNRRVELNLIQP